jgi:hypothetical protein
MAHFAELDENKIVLRVIVVHNNELLDENGNELEQKGIDFCVAHYGGTWLQTSYNANFRKNYAGIGFVYDPIRDAFISPKPTMTKNFEGQSIVWELDENTCHWVSEVIEL